MLHSRGQPGWPAALRDARGERLASAQDGVGSARLTFPPRFFQLSATHADDWGRFARTLMEIRANQADEEEEGPMELAS